MDKRNQRNSGEDLDSESRATVRAETVRAETPIVIWNVFDKEMDTVVTVGDRPHWDQTGALTFVTFRLADSMPQAVIQCWEAEQKAWLRHNGLEHHSIEDAIQQTTVPENLRRQFLKFRKQRWHKNLDDCHGDCVLRQPDLADIVADSLLKFHGERYDVERFVEIGRAHV